MGPSESDWQHLETAARAVCAHAYCPYSRFPVGAAVLTAKGAIVVGCNVENASYGLALCAERNAVFQAITRGEREIIAVAVYTPTLTPATPCGACRQVLNEFGSEVEIQCFCDGNQTIRTRLADLLPLAFGPKNLA